MDHSCIFILGGARSGKSAYTLELVKRKIGKVLFVATATASDEDMQKRIGAHRDQRPAHWHTLEAPIRVSAAIREALPVDWIILDCVTLLASNLLLEMNDPVTSKDYETRLAEEISSLIGIISSRKSNWVIVSNEVGLGLVPPYPLGRVFRDGLGRANQRLAQAADTVLLMVAGIPTSIKGSLPDLD